MNEWKIIHLSLPLQCCHRFKGSLELKYYWLLNCMQSNSGGVPCHAGGDTHSHINTPPTGILPCILICLHMSFFLFFPME